MSWDWDRITAISSIIGVFGGLISAIFLIYEVRHNAKAIEGATVQSLMSLEREVFTFLADNAGLFIRGSKNISQLSAEERLKFDRIVGAQMSLYYSAFVQFEQHLIDHEVWEAYLNAVKSYMAAPGFSISWNAMEHRYPGSFRNVIDLG